MTPGNQNKSNSQLLPVPESSAVSGTEEMIPCLSRDCFPSCVGTTAGKQVSSHKQRRGTFPSVGKVTAPEAFQRQRWLFFPCRTQPWLCSVLSKGCASQYLMLHLISRHKWYFPYPSLILRPPFRVRIAHPFPLPTPTMIFVSQTQQ